MQIRHATPADFPAIADLCAVAFEDDNLFIYLHPYLKEHPADFRDVFLRSVKSRYYDPDTHILVAVTEKSDANFGGHPEVLGYAAWTLEGPSISARKQPFGKRTIVCVSRNSWIDQLQKFGEWDIVWSQSY